ncbi:RAD51-associated protein 2 [Zootoca vivipara]|uniref:uncharacterized protein LOC118082790 n=1 Tax=Zootoca vivipara TaxID=8524 RepID=UPI00158FDE1B|nr:uncharacterized protein LOC118082790 [Zootoca vivipara]XP_060128247.1 RAD51-associated protein 2 [Zootoca vivipara]
MESSSLQALLSISEEMEEPWPKKLKTDSQVSSNEQRQLLKSLCYADKKSPNMHLGFPEGSSDFSQNNLELQEKNSTKNNLRQYLYFRLCMNANLHSRLLGNIPFIEKWALENDYCSNLKDSGSEFNENYNSKPWTIFAKEKEKSIDSGNISKKTELPSVNILSYDILAENIVVRIEYLLTDVPAFQTNENGTGCHHVHGEQNHIPKPVADGGRISGKTPLLCLLAGNFMKGRKSNIGSFLYEYKHVVGEDENILFRTKQTNPLAKNNLRRNKVYKHMYISYSRSCGVVNTKLVKCAAFELFLHDCSTAVKKNASIFSHFFLLNTQQREMSNGTSTMEHFEFSRYTIEDGSFSVVGNEKEQMARQLIISNKHIFPENYFHSSTLWGERLCSPTVHNLTANFRLFNYLTSAPLKFGKCSIQQSNLPMVSTMEPNIQKRTGEFFNENNAFPVKKFKASHFILRAHSKAQASKSNLCPRIRTCSRSMMNKTRNGNCEDCGSTEMKVNLYPFDTYKQICLSTDSEEISFIGNVIFNVENKKKYSKGYFVPDRRITCSGCDTLTYNCVLPQLYTICNPFLEQKSKSKKSQYPKDINNNSQRHTCEDNNMHFPINGLNSGNVLKYNGDQYFTSTVSYDLCIDQNRPVSVKAQRYKISRHGKRRKPIKKGENLNLLLQKSIFLNSTHNPELASVKQNAKEVDKKENSTFEQSYISKRNQPQNITMLCFNYGCGESASSKDKLTMTSCTMKQGHFEDAIEKHLSSEIKSRHEFELKNQFDLVLKELFMFNEISKENVEKEMWECGKRNFFEKDPLVFNHSDSILDEDSRNIFENKVNVTFTTTGSTGNSTVVKHTTGMKPTKNEQSLFKNTVIKSPGEQEVPHDHCPSSVTDEEMFYAPSQEPGDSPCKQPFTWSPAFVPHTFMEEKSYGLRNERGDFLLDGIVRVQPLKTCRGPLRVGLSKKAKPKQLHPYLK